MTRASLLIIAFAFASAGCSGCSKSTVPADDDRDLDCDEDCACDDVSPSLGTVEAFPLRGRVIEEDELPVDITDADPYTMIIQDERDGIRLSLALRVGEERFELAEIRADDEGYVDARIAVPEGVPAGQHILEIDAGGQPSVDARVYLMPTDAADVVVRSDVDMTYMLTDFQSAGGIVDLLESDSTEREALPGMPVVYRSLRDGAEGTAARPLCFLSGSPRFFKRTLEGRMLLDDVVHDGIVLKPFKDIVAANLLDFDFDEIAPELEEQIGYKLDALLTLRLDIAPGTPELLMGDDTEADHVIYALYHRFTSGLLDPAGLDAALADLNVDASWRESIRVLAPRVAAHLAGQPAPVQAIYVNHTDSTGDVHAVADWIEPGLTRYHRGAWPLALDLFEDGRISAAQIERLRVALDAAGVGVEARFDAATDGVTAGFVEQATVERFAD